MSIVMDDVRRFCTAAAVAMPVNEAETEARLVLPLLGLLGWSGDARFAIRRQVSTHTLFADIQLTVDDRPLCVIEVKRTDAALFVSGRDPREDVIAALTKQGRAAFEQVLGYAVSDGIPFAWVTNGMQHLVFRVPGDRVPLERRLVFVGQDQNDLVRRFDELQRLAPSSLQRLHVADWSDTAGVAVAAESAQEVAYRQLLSVCSAASSRHLSLLADPPAGANVRSRPVLKYSPSTFVSRPQYEQTFDDFWCSSSSVLMFSGEAGIGKTSLLCHLVRTIQDRVGAVPCLFRDGFQIPGGLRDALHQVLSDFTRNEVPHDLDAAMECVEEYVLGRKPFSAVLAVGDVDRSRQQVLLQNLLIAATETGADLIPDLIQPLLTWAAGRSADTAVAERLRFIAAAPVPPPTSSLRSILPNRLRLLTQYAPEAVASLKNDAETQGWVETMWDGPDLEAVDALAVVAAFAPGVAPAERRDLTRHARDRWLGPLLDALLGAPPAQLLGAPHAARQALVRLLASTAVPKLLVFVDAINESRAPGLLAADLVAVAEQMRGRLAKLVVSCRTPDVRFFDSDVFHRMRFSPDRVTTSLDAFGDLEFLAAWEFYREAYGIHGNIGPVLKELCRNPLILRLMCEGFAGGGVPEDDIRLIEIFDAYWRRKVEGGGDARGRAIILLQLAELAHEFGAATNEGETAVVPLARCRDLIAGGTAVLDALISEAVVVFLSPTTDGRSGVRFMYESFHEYVLARNVREHYGTDLSAAIDATLKVARRDRLLRGALAYLLLWIDQEGGDASPWVARLYERGFHSDAVMMATKLRQTRSTVAIVKRLRSEPLAAQDLFVLARSLSRHIRAAGHGALGEMTCDALHDPRRAISITAYAVALLEGKDLDLPEDLRIVLFGFRRLWELGVKSDVRPDDRVAEFVASRRASRVLEIGRYYRGRVHDARQFWSYELESMNDNNAIANAIALGIRSIGREVLLREPAPELPAHGAEVVAWIAAVQRTAGIQPWPFWRRALEQLNRFVRGGGTAVPRRRMLVTDIVSLDASLSRHMRNGSELITIFVARLVRLIIRCRKLLLSVRELEPRETSHLIVTTILNALIELATLCGPERHPQTALLWLGDLREACLEEVSRLGVDDLRLQDIRAEIQALWREILSIGTALTCDVLPLDVRPRCT